MSSLIATAIGFFRRPRTELDGNRKKPVKAKPKVKITKQLTRADNGGARIDRRHDRYLGGPAARARRAQWDVDHPGERYPYDRPDYWGP